MPFRNLSLSSSSDMPKSVTLGSNQSLTLLVIAFSHNRVLGAGYAERAGIIIKYAKNYMGRCGRSYGSRWTKGHLKHHACKGYTKWFETPQIDPLCIKCNWEGSNNLLHFVSLSGSRSLSKVSVR